eukprot:TRINITY_DN5337_c0_g1_i1.p1 TRINITY_DN5337_c0_g1~~TRINITY_DN5337_c0_g1_i1.p1  ORF type:complete len:145 (-),score=8.18 TRINITY_DN5337_c0_g1_i1:304-738(-)
MPAQCQSVSLPKAQMCSGVDLSFFEVHGLAMWVLPLCIRSGSVQLSSVVGNQFSSPNANNTVSSIFLSILRSSGSQIRRAEKTKVILVETKGFLSRQAAALSQDLELEPKSLGLRRLRGAVVRGCVTWLLGGHPQLGIGCGSAE